MKNTVYNTEQKGVVKGWITSWSQFFELLNKVTGPGMSPPTEEDEISYQKIRVWFLSNEHTFIPIWNDFCEYRREHYGEKAEELPRDLEDVDDERFVCFMRNPFSFYYRHGTLYQWADYIGIKSGTVEWEPDEEEMSKIRPILGFLAQVLVWDFSDWIEGKYITTG